MLQSQSHSRRLLDINGHDLFSSASTPPYDPAALDLAEEQSGQPDQEYVVTQDPLTYHRALSHTNMPPSCSTHESVQDTEGYICHIGEFGAFDSQVGRRLQQGKARENPYNLAVRLANRSNTGPLATIVEQGSCPTLNSHYPLVRFAYDRSLEVTERASSSQTSHKASWISNEIALHRPNEDALQSALCVMTDAREDLSGQDCRTPRPVTYTTTPLVSLSLEQPQYTGSQNDIYHTLVDRNSRAFPCGVLQNVRAGWEAGFSSSARQDVLDDQVKTSESSSQHRLPRCETVQRGDYSFETPYLMPALPLSTTCAFRPHSQARNRKGFTADSALSAHSYVPLITPLLVLNTEVDFVYIPNLLTPMDTTRSRERSTSVHLVQPKPRAAVHDDGLAQMPALLNKCKNDASAHLTSEGVSVSLNSTPLVTDCDHAREPSRNASFCSTTSTSYSGTVLGVDLDLHHESLHTVASSPTSKPVAPMRFTPQMVEHEHQTSFARSLKPLRVPATETPRRLLTSSALSSLLPIAAATGIVRRNYNTPNISFYSLSGNVIQLERISVPGKSAYDFYGSLSITTSYYNKHATLAPLPAHPKYRHDYQRYEGPQIDSHKSLIMSNSSVAGCGGVVTNNSSKCQTEAARSHMPHKTTSRCKHQRIRSTIHDLISRINIDKARILTLATPSSAWRGKNGRMINDRNASACTCIRANKFQKKKLVYLLPVSAAGQLDD